MIYSIVHGPYIYVREKNKSDNSTQYHECHPPNKRMWK